MHDQAETVARAIVVMAANECAVAVLVVVSETVFTPTRGARLVFVFQVSRVYADGGVNFLPAVLRGGFDVLIGRFHCSASPVTGSKTTPAIGSVSHMVGVVCIACSVSAWAGWLQARIAKAVNNTPDTSKARLK